MDFFHVCREVSVGSLIQPGGWGGRILMPRAEPHPFREREDRLERWRNSANVQVSRLNCAYAFGTEADARWYQAEGEAARQEREDPEEFIYRVTPAHSDTLRVRLDMYWVSFMGEPGGPEEHKDMCCQAYWAGHSITTFRTERLTTWEWLFSGPLLVRSLVARSS